MRHSHCLICGSPLSEFTKPKLRATCSHRCRRAKMLAERYIARMQGRVRSGAAMPYQTKSTSSAMRIGVRLYIQLRGGAK